MKVRRPSRFYDNEERQAWVEALEATVGRAYDLAAHLIESADYTPEEADLLWPLWHDLQEYEFHERPGRGGDA